MSNQIVPVNDMSTEQVALAFVKSGYFQDANDASKAIVKILAGRELGFGPFASMNSIDIIQGRPAAGADLMAAAVKRSARYDYRIREMTASNCAIEFFERIGGKLESIGMSTFSLDDARKAGTKNLDRFPRNMLFARAMSNGVRWFCPDVFSTSVYTPEELGANVNENGEVIDVQPVIVQAQPVQQQAKKPQPQPAAEIATPENWAKFEQLADEAAAFGLTVYEPAQGCTVDELRAAYGKLLADVKEARALEAAAEAENVPPVD